MGLLDDLLGNTSADASRKAAADTYGKQQAATGSLLANGQGYADAYKNLSTGYDPWIQTGQGANTALQRLLADPSSVSSLPGYQFQMDQGTKAIDGSAAARGGLFSGKTGKDLSRFGQNLADTTYNSRVAQLLGISGQGLGAQQGQIGTVGTGLNGQLGAQQAAYGGQMQSAGTIGEGDIAAANAKQKGVQNLLNTGVSLAGMALGGGMGMPSFGNIGSMLNATGAGSMLGGMGVTYGNPGSVNSNMAGPLYPGTR